ncbi:phosphoribosyl-glycinamide transformylase [Lipomyces oligophaga]|uniref:phosphoribosyl-glycinamide transformylase n=1 Tax=Lipomyces oligophaga TaxID=45792 RepID=UPI0034CFB89E
MGLPKILVLISGYGSNLQALIDASTGVRTPAIPGKICCVLASSSSAYGLERARKADIPTETHDLQEYYSNISRDDKIKRRQARKQFNIDLAEKVLKYQPDLVVCAGWMLILSPSFLIPLSHARIPIINLHPALPGQFAGTHAIERAWEAGQRGEITKGGLMIHRVIQEVDEGEPLIVKELDLDKDESVDDYESRVHQLEHVAIIEGTILALKELDFTKSVDPPLEIANLAIAKST